MKYRIAIWSIAGLLVAGFWAIFARATFPSADPMRDVWPLITFTCPVALLGMHHQVSLYEVLAANAVTYAVVGLIVVAMLRPFRHAQ